MALKDVHKHTRGVSLFPNIWYLNCMMSLLGHRMRLIKLPITQTEPSLNNSISIFVVTEASFSQLSRESDICFS